LLVREDDFWLGLEGGIGLGLEDSVWLGAMDVFWLCVEGIWPGLADGF